MNRLRLAVVFAVAVVGLGSIAMAQVAGGPPPRPSGPGAGARPGGPGGMGGMRRGKPGDMQRHILEGLKLTPAQKAKTDAYIDHMVKEREALRPKGGGRPDRAAMQALRPKFDAITKEFEGKLSKVLSKDQFKKYHDQSAAMRARFMRGGPGGPGGRPGGPGGPGGRPGGPGGRIQPSRPGG